MSTEKAARKYEYRLPRQLLATGLAGLCLAGCTPRAQNTQTNTAETYVQLVPDMQSFLKPGDDKHCFNGGERPCAILLRTEPKLSAATINADKNTVRVEWPLESYGNKKGDELSVRCYDPKGQEIKSYENSLASTDWYQVIVPEDKVTNAEAHPDSATINGTKAYIGWASVTWFNQNEHNPAVPKC